jgi:AcrR family transcriptional regulator
MPNSPSPGRPNRRAITSRRSIDPERTRGALLDAALDEFAAKGYAGARVRDIAQRAGVSKDLVAYHFGGKEGLYLTVQRRWLDEQGDGSAPGTSWSDAVLAHLTAATVDPRPMRLLAWRGLVPDHAAPDGSGADHPFDSSRRPARSFGLREGLDPAVMALVALAVVAAPVVFPDVVARLFGTPPTSSVFVDRYRQGLADVLGLLEQPPSARRRTQGAS